MICPKCNSDEVFKMKWNTLINNEHRSYGVSHFRPKNLHDALIKGGIVTVVYGSKLALSRVYRCSKCWYEWRKWHWD
jgi:DNA-directed RNA polymerase subunit RPC12/RpoP